jgi:hypothetical protein
MVAADEDRHLDTAILASAMDNTTRGSSDLHRRIGAREDRPEDPKGRRANSMAEDSSANLRSSPRSCCSCCRLRRLLTHPPPRTATEPLLSFLPPPWPTRKRRVASSLPMYKYATGTSSTTLLMEWNSILPLSPAPTEGAPRRELQREANIGSGWRELWLSFRHDTKLRHIGKP